MSASDILKISSKRVVNMKQSTLLQHEKNQSLTLSKTTVNLKKFNHKTPIQRIQNQKMSATRMSATTKNLKTSNLDNLYSRQPLKNTSGASSIKKLNFKVSSIFTQKQIPNNLEQPIVTPAPFATIDHLPGTDRHGSTSKIHNSRNNSNQKVHSPRQIQFQLKSAYTPRD